MKTRHFPVTNYGQSHPPSADLRYGEEDSISPGTLILAAITG